MKFTKLDWIIFSVSVILFTASCYLLMAPENIKLRKITKVAEDSIGFVVPIGRDVRVRAATQTAWQQINSDYFAKDQDRLFTGTDSKALVQFTEDSKIEITPNSLIILEKQQQAEQLDLNIKSGSFYSQLQKNEKLTLKSGDQTTTIRGTGATMKIERSAEGAPMKITVLSGEAEFSKNGKVETLTKNQTVKMDAKGEVFERKSLPIQLNFPEPLSKAWIKQGQKIKFEWKSGDSKNEKLIVATDPDFKNVIVEEAANDKIEVNIKKYGTFYWKVTSGEDSSPESSFTVLAFSSPELVTPEQNFSYEFTTAEISEKQLSFIWSDDSQSDEYEFKLATDADFKNILFEEVTKSRMISFSGFPESKYFWRVLSKSKNRGEEIYSSIGSFSIKVKQEESEPVEIRMPAQQPPEVLPEPTNTELTIAPTPEPMPVMPKEGPRFEKTNYQFELFDKLPKRPLTQGFAAVIAPEFSWSESQNAKYKLQISTQSDFSSIAFDADWSSNHFTWSEGSAGIYYLRVYSYDENGELSLASETVKMRVIVSAPEVFEAKVSEWDAVAQQSELKILAYVNRKSVQLEVQVAKDEDFSELELTTVVDKQPIKIPLKEYGDHFVRIRSLNSTKWPISRYSRIRKVFVSSPVVLSQNGEPIDLEKPELLQNKIEKKNSAYAKYYIWGGAGADILTFQQTSSSGTGSGTFSSITTPSLMGTAGFALTDRWGFKYEYHTLPGKIPVSASTVTLNQSSYNWNTQNLEFQLRFSEDYAKHDIRAVFGYQMHQMPLLYTKNDASVERVENKINAATFGFDIDFNKDQDWYFNTMLRYQYPLSSQGMGGDLKITPSVSFDGSLGAIRKLGDNWRAGVFWFGQYHDLRYNFTPNDGSTAIEGSAKYFNSNLQIRIGYEYYFGMTVITMFGVFGFRRRKKKNGY